MTSGFPSQMTGYAEGISMARHHNANNCCDAYCCESWYQRWESLRGFLANNTVQQMLTLPAVINSEPQHDRDRYRVFVEWRASHPLGNHGSIAWVAMCGMSVNSSPLNKMAAISQTIFSDALSWMKSLVIWLKFDWNSLLMIPITQHWFR